ncbi:DUF2057 family protein [Vibrio artabrorum]|uniref:YccT family protein n=1 Tax=Vibrio artabrorum TaxID=446374 RepID=UPI00354DE02B
MKVINKMFVIGTMLTSFAPMAAVDLTLDRNIAALVVHGEEVGFSISKADKFDFENGRNQIVLRVEQLVSNLGEKEKFNSYPIVLTFDAEDVSLNVATKSPISRKEHANAFQKNPKFVITDETGKEVQVKQDVLPVLSGISRDYVKELNRYNSMNSINLATVTTGSEKTKTESKRSSEANQSLQMVEYWYNKASANDKSQFSDWAFDNRNEQDLTSIEGSKPVEMASYWFAQGSVEERKKILSWLLEQ